MKIEAELAEKDIIKIFKFETYNQATVVKAFYGWEDYTKEKAAAVASKIKEGNIKESAILYGAPGCGKTSYVENVTKAIATKLRQDVIFYNIKNADLKTKTQNSATAHINQLFDQVFKKAETVPVVVFFDEFDGISTKRESIEQENHNKIDHQNNDVTALLLQKIEEAAGKKNILIFAATNHIENMDDALIRTGRFDYRIHIGKPNVEMRTEIIKKIFSNSKEEELNILLHLTSNQTTVDVAKTVNLFLKFKEEEEEEEKKIELFASHTIQAQNSRQKSHIDDSKINEWIEKVKEENSIKLLIVEEQKNSEIVSIQAIQDQEIFPSLKRSIANVIRAEEINESKEERFIRVLTERLKPLEKIEEQLKNLADEKYKQLEILNKNKKEEIENLDAIARSLEKIVDEKTMKEYLHQTAKAFAAINIQSQAELGFNHRKMIILEYFENFKKEKEYLLINDETISEQTLLYLLLLFTDKFSYAELSLVLQDLFINRFYAPGGAEVNKAINKNIFLLNQNNYNALSSLVIKESRPQATITERKSFEENEGSQLSSFEEVLKIFEKFAFRIVLREEIFSEVSRYKTSSRCSLFPFFMGEVVRLIKILIEDKKNSDALDEEIKVFISKFNLKANSEDERSEIRKTNLNKNNPNSYIQLSTLEEIITFLITIKIENIDDVKIQLKKILS
jgi:SpoVK/Ycf46/Vps4 family AAA+-type ATPase